MKNRCVFLYGAGATICWNSPTTKELTDLVRNSGFKVRDSDERITEFLYQRLLNAGHKEGDINFETIVNIIEELIIYYSYDNGDERTPSLMRGFFKPNEIDVIFNFSIEGGMPKHGYRLNIPAGESYPYSNSACNNETPEQFFLQHLLAEILTNISARISKYSYHSEDHSTINIDCNASVSYSKWMDRLSHRSVLRLYTLNYDRIFKILLERAKISVFEGFDVGEYIGLGAYRANILKILADTDSQVHYNLHGCAYWDVLDYDQEDLPNAEVILRGFPNLQVNNSTAVVQMDKGRPVTITNIITGFQKTQKVALTPFKQMHASFDKDCCFAEVIYIIGYSFGDEHINQSLKAAIRFNKNVKLVIVDPGFKNNGIDYKLGITILPYRSEHRFNIHSIEDNIYSFVDGLVTVFEMTFNDFLEYCNNPLRNIRSPLI